MNNSGGEIVKETVSVGGGGGGGTSSGGLSWVMAEQQRLRLRLRQPPPPLAAAASEKGGDETPSEKSNSSKYHETMARECLNYKWRLYAKPIDLSTPVFISTPCREYLFAIVGCKPPDSIQRHERLYYKCVVCPPDEALTMQGPHPHPKNWYVFDNPTFLLRRTAKYKKPGLRWMTLKVPRVILQHQSFFDVPLKFISKRWGGPGFISSDPEKVKYLESLKIWTKKCVNGACRAPQLLNKTPVLSLADSVSFSIDTLAPPTKRITTSSRPQPPPPPPMSQVSESESESA